ncbi:MAG: 2-succinyl-5-enolpyruvyl-6-hydroxy-3-cyclohexene-1-carboxylic-acid synthase [Nitriliruptoraceae bacterium]
MTTAAPNPSTAMARAMVDECVRHGVTDAVLAPGSRSAALAFSLYDDPRIALHVHPDERSAAFVALGLARASGRPAVVVTTSGSAVANLHPAVIEADLDRVPMVLITADRPVELRETGANQTIDQVGLFGSTVRWAFDVPAAEDRADAPGLWRSVISRAVAASLGVAGGKGPAGPVHLNVGFREPTVPAADDGRSAPAPWSHDEGGRDDSRRWVHVEPGVVQPAPATVERLFNLIVGDDGPRRGVVVVGQTRQSTSVLLELADRLGWPVLAEPTGSIRSHGAVIGHGHHVCAHPGFMGSHRPAIALRVGRATLSPAIDAALTDAEQIVIDPDGMWIDPDRRIAEIIVADADRLAESLLARLADGPADQGTDNGRWCAAWRDADRAVATAIDEVLGLATDAAIVTPAEPVDLSEPAIARLLPAVVPAGTRLVAASSMPIRDLDRYMGVGAEVVVDANRGASGIDGFVSSLLGVRLATDPDVPVVGVAGDLASLHDVNGWLLSADERTPASSVTLVVVDNDGGGIFSFLPQAQFPAAFERVFGTPHGRDFAHVALLHDLDYQRADDAPGFVAALHASTARPGRHLVHVSTSRSDNVALHRQLDQHIAQRLSQDW